MIIEWKILLLTFPIALCLLLCCYGTGVLLSRVVSANIKHERLSPDPQSIFWKLTGGLIFLVGLYAVITTHFRTSLLPILFLACALLRLETFGIKPGKAIIPTYSCRAAWVFLFTAIFFYWLIYALHFIIPVYGNISFISGDTLFYARAADYLNFSGVETVTIDYSTISKPLPEPYHYGDLWTIAFVQKLTGLPSALIVLTIVYPVLAAIFFLGLANYVYPADKEKGSHINYPLLLLCGFTSGFAFLFPSFLFSESSHIGIPIVFVPKLFFAAIFFIAILLSLKDESWNRTIIITSAGSLLFINIAPALLIAAGVLSVYWLFKRRKNIQRSAKPVYCILGFLSLIYFFLFYKINSSAGFDPADLPFSLHTFVNILAAGLLQFLPLFPFVFLFFLWGKKTDTLLHKRTMPNDLLILIMFSIASLISWSIFYTSTPEAVQFFSNTLIPVSCIIVAAPVFQALASKRKKIIVLALVLFGLSVLLNRKLLRGHSSVSKEDLAVVSKFLKHHQPGKFANIRGAKEFNNYFVRNTMFIQPLSFITYLYPGYNNISLNTPAITIDSSWSYAQYEKKMLASAPFNQYIKNRDTTVSMEEYAYLFITEHRFRYLAVSPDTSLPQRLVPLVKDSVLLSDNWHIYYIEK